MYNVTVIKSITLVRGIVQSVRLGLLTNLTAVVTPSSRDEWLEFERNQGLQVSKGYGLDLYASSGNV